MASSTLVTSLVTPLVRPSLATEVTLVSFEVVDTQTLVTEDGQTLTTENNQEIRP